MKKALKRRIKRAVDQIFDLARPGVCSCWPKCDMKEARKILRKLVRRAGA